RTESSTRRRLLPRSHLSRPQSQAPRPIRRGGNIMRILSLAVGLAMAAVSGMALANDYPTKPITFVVPYAPGGNVDVSTRILQKALGDSLGQPVVVENRPGGGGLIAGAYVARSKPDGYTLFVGSNGPVLFGPMTRPNAPYN